MSISARLFSLYTYCHLMLTLTMPKVTYPRPCPICRKSFSKGHFLRHRKRCGTTVLRVKCPFCQLTFAYKQDMKRHVRQQHSNNPLRFACMICEKVLKSAQNLNLHMKTAHADEKPCFDCWYCNAKFTSQRNRQRQMRGVHGRICREQEINLHLHLQHLSESDDFQEEWQFVESRPIERGEHKVCPCGQAPIESYFFLENKCL